MSESAGQNVVVDDKWSRYDWKRRAAVRLVGEGAARRIARPVSITQAWLRSGLTATGRDNREFLRQFKNAHVGERCVIIGNGPSLKNTDMSLLREERTFGLNRIYLMFDEIGFETTFHVVVNRFVVEQCAEDFRNLNSPLFTTSKNADLLEQAPNTAFMDPVVGPWFSRDPSRGVCEGFTVTYVAMQLAYFMGFSEVILVGVDHRFAVQGTPNQLVESSGDDKSHFDPRYFAKGFKWQLPDLENSELAYHVARQAFEKSGRKIVDCTVDGALEVFPKMPLQAALAK